MSDASSPTSNRRTESADRRRRAVALRIAGASFEQIGEQLGITRQSAHALVVKALSEIAKQTAESAEQLRAIELQRLDALQAALWADAMRGDEQKTDRVLRVMSRRAALLGLDAPTKQDVTYSDADVTRAIAAELARVAGGGKAEVAEAAPADANADSNQPS